MKALILGASGMLGNTVMRVMSEDSELQVTGTVRSARAIGFFSNTIQPRLISGIDVENHDALIKLFSKVRPQIVINCIGLVKQLADAEDPLVAIPVNSLLPHRLANLCGLAGARLIHISTDCVFSGEKGGYTENDVSDAKDIYGKSKFLGEVDYPHAITLRTSIVGHELQSAHGLVDWFLAQQVHCKGYTRAIFSGLPTVVLSRIIRDIVIPRPELRGVYHIASAPISKYELLKIVADEYGKTIDVVPDDKLVIDRSLNAERFKQATDFSVPDWRELVSQMHFYK